MSVLAALRRGYTGYSTRMTAYVFVRGCTASSLVFDWSDHCNRMQVLASPLRPEELPGQCSIWQSGRRSRGSDIDHGYSSSRAGAPTAASYSGQQPVGGVPHALIHAGAKRTEYVLRAQNDTSIMYYPRRGAKCDAYLPFDAHKSSERGRLPAGET